MPLGGGGGGGKKGKSAFPSLNQIAFFSGNERCLMHTLQTHAAKNYVDTNCVKDITEKEDFEI